MPNLKEKKNKGKEKIEKRLKIKYIKWRDAKIERYWKDIPPKSSPEVKAIILGAIGEATTFEKFLEHL